MAPNFYARPVHAAGTSLFDRASLREPRPSLSVRLLMLHLQGTFCSTTCLTGLSPQASGITKTVRAVQTTWSTDRQVEVT